jgi:hypothetical protein
MDRQVGIDMSVLQGEQARQAMARMRQRAGEFAVHTAAQAAELDEEAEQRAGRIHRLHP